ncbi:mucin-17-like [Hyla sarda]|uniref:mucin-17-like n=1 Tax=Hyla sarda TaxID=327740 RepID=UPI0024C3287F|nr:mucin-17-like [Hyla sarda]
MNISTDSTIKTTLKPGVVILPCQNNGTFDGNKCVCKLNFYGTLCEFILEAIRPVSVTASVDVTVRVLNINYTKELEDFTSAEYKEFETRFENEMKIMYKPIPNYEGVKIISLKEGSVVIDHLLLVKVPIDTYDDVTNEVANKVTTILESTNCTDEITHNINETLCFNYTATVRNLPINATGICSNVSEIPQEVQQYYTFYNDTGIAMCISRCSSLSPDRINCNKGQCSVTWQGPHCYCETSDEYWYTGDRCQTAISKPGVYAGVAVGLFVLLVIIVALAVISYRRRKASDSDKLIEKEMRWYEDGYEVDNQDAPYSTGSASGSTNSSFQPNLDKVNTNIKMNIPRAAIVPGGSNFSSSG